MRTNHQKKIAKERYKRIRDNNIQEILSHYGIASLSCKTCGIWKPSFSFYDFHHRDPSTKDASISSMMGNVNTEKLLVEIDKCDVLCPNCHRQHHIDDNKQKEIENEEINRRKILEINVCR